MNTNSIGILTSEFLVFSTNEVIRKALTFHLNLNYSYPCIKSFCMNGSMTERENNMEKMKVNGINREASGITHASVLAPLS